VDSADANCQLDNGYLPPEKNPTNLRLFHTKQRYGVEALYAPLRYYRGLTEKSVPPAAGEHPSNSMFYQGEDNAACTNPLYAASLPAKAADGWCERTEGSRSPYLVFFATIGGVPADLLPNDGKIDDARWKNIVGDSIDYQTAGVDPRMIQSTSARGADNDRDTLGADLQYACTFTVDNGKTKTVAVAYPMTRQLDLAWALDGVVGSICDPEGYTRTMNLLIDRMRDLFPK
jgi:hypothetical protein